MRLEEIDESHVPKILASAEVWHSDESPFVADFLGSWRENRTAAALKKIMIVWQKERMDWRPKPGKISVTRYVLINDSDDMVAFGLMRFPLDRVTEADGGNIVCFVPSNLRGKGYGSYCLALMLFEAVRSGLRRVLVTCPESDPGARRVIELNRGRLEDVRPSPDLRREGEPIARYWIDFSG